ncbi:odorant receptor 4-like [Anticarsia gemmatalis]|uniref:odorant receptor 4-like n=1 Tax=Anticarsia gemmatalis TaxID=129554 RepID=UPI003F77384C
MNLFVKIVTFNLQISRINKINKLIKDPIFGGNSAMDEELLLNNQRGMQRLYKIINISVSIAGLFWPASHFFKRYQNANAAVPSYVPFDTDTWSKFTISVLFEVVPLLWIGYGHLAFDCVMSAYYAQAEVQLKIIKHNLEHLFYANVHATAENFKYRDESDGDLKQRFIYYVQRFEKLAWYAKEIDTVFGPIMSFEFLSSSVIMCMVVYLMSFTPVASIPFMFMVVLLLITSTQVFLYCYFGNLVQYESQSIVNSVYLSDWVSVSPKFRRLLLIAMQRWSRTLAPKVSGIVPLSLSTFVSIIRSAYSMYAVLGTRKA